MNEAETRAEHIDPALKAAGWGVVPGSRIRREYPIAPGRIEGHGKRGKPLTADYILEYRNTKLAVNEAKAWDEALTEGVAQAKNYAIYSLKEGINDGFLTPFKVKQIQTTIDYYVFTPDDTVVEGEIEAGKLYDETDFNRNIEIREREKKRVETFMSQINQNEKTLVFCTNQAHALLVRDLINQLKTSEDPNYCQRVEPCPRLQKSPWFFRQTVVATRRKISYWWNGANGRDCTTP
jgi:type I site-specific restriction endonuclease